MDKNKKTLTWDVLRGVRVEDDKGSFEIEVGAGTAIEVWRDLQREEEGV